jgi:hypothetical protein
MAVKGKLNQQVQCEVDVCTSSSSGEIDAIIDAVCLVFIHYGRSGCSLNPRLQ